MPFQLKCYFLGDKITKKRVLLYLKTVFFSRNDVLVPCASKIENNTKYMYLVLDEKQLNAQRHVLCTWNENLGFARPSVTYDFFIFWRTPFPKHQKEEKTREERKEKRREKRGRGGNYLLDQRERAVRARETCERMRKMASSQKEPAPALTLVS